jgi:glycosyltransferase involved in cell wall biosynthesis
VIGISLLTLVPGVVGGSETYVRELCRALARRGRMELTAFVPTIAADAADGLPSRVITGYRASSSPAGRVRAMALAAARPRPLRRELGVDELDAIHFPLSVMLPSVGRTPAATTIHDLQHEFLPQNFGLAERTYRRVAYGRAARRSRIVITLSEHARRTIVDRMELEPERVRAIHLAVDHERFTPADVPREPFLLYPANAWPHKNHATLFRALELLPELRLVLTGSGHNRPLPARVEALGRVSERQLVDLYRRAAALVFPTLYEGFGQPALESLACACPAAVSDLPPLREVCGDAAVYFDPSDPEAIAAGVREALARGGATGPARAALFTWDACARRHEEVYRELIAAA